MSELQSFLYISLFSPCLFFYFEVKIIPMKKLVFILLCGLILNACGGDSEQTQKTDKDSTQKEEKPANEEVKNKEKPTEDSQQPVEESIDEDVTEDSLKTATPKTK
jgi:hypothetical protein